jgi:hypothetical protein
MIAIKFSMSWDERAQELSSVTSASAIVSIDGNLLGKAKDFAATPAELKEWVAMFKDLTICRQKGLSYGGKKLFVTQYNESRIIAMRDHFVVLLCKGREAIVCGVCEQAMSPEAANAACQKLAADLG